MAKLPKALENRKELDNRLGIKSSLSDLSSVVALCYALYCANDKNSVIEYAEEYSSVQGKKQIKLKSCFGEAISQKYEVNIDLLNENPLLKSQLEALQVGLSLMFKIGAIRFIDFPSTDTLERTGGKRYRKVIYFSTNMMILDLYIGSWSEEVIRRELKQWLLNTPEDSEFSIGLKKLLVIFSEDTLYKIRVEDKFNVVFQQEGIYSTLAQGYHVIAKDVVEDVGPFRVFKSFVKEGLHPYLQIEANEFLLKKGVSIQTYHSLVDTALQLTPKVLKVFNQKERNLEFPTITVPLQTIYYGAPGTGKSHKIKTLHKENVVRTTFHPDSDYSTFVGAYKPTMEEVERYESSGTPIREKRIVYNYVPQAFLRAYTSAWKKYPKPQYLVIEEINRGNCAQIFGDLFQLLDRHETGFSDYPICADSDIQRYLSEEFSKCNFTEIIGEETEAIQEMYAQECPDILNQIQLGNLLLLPKNLYILATMNTSDQSLFPIDSAFKRRWHWEYTPIRNGGKEWTIEANGQHWDWWAFLQAINERIEETTSSEDKKLGYFFVKAGDKGASIKASLFVGKVIFYLWNDVYKDYGFDDSIFQDSNGEQITFPRFYEINEANEEVNEELVANFLRNVVGKSIEESHSDEINKNKE